MNDKNLLFLDRLPVFYSKPVCYVLKMWSMLLQGDINSVETLEWLDPD